MFRTASSYKRFFSLVIALTFVVFLFSPELQKRPVRLLGKPVGTLVYYLQAGLYGFLSGIESVWYGYVDLVNVRNENLLLRRQVEELKGENSQLREDGERATRLQTMLDYKEQTPYRFIAAEVIGRELSNWYETIMINRGERDGVATDMGVITPSGIVGKVVKIGPHFAQVLLMTDNNSAVAAINQRTRDEGIVEGVERGKVRVKYLTQFAEVQPNDAWVTSGLEGSFPKGIMIGKTDRVEHREHDLFLYVEITPEVNLSRLEEVFVVAGFQKEPS
jgi:rod shape-determining protein MreC